VLAYAKAIRVIAARNIIIFFMAFTPLTRDYGARYNVRFLTHKLFIISSRATGGRKNMSECPPVA
jgi:hypothetical protein